MSSTVLARAGRAALAAAAILALLPAAAQAALSVALVGGDALEDRAMTFVATGTTTGGNEIYSRFRPAGGLPCAPSYTADSGTSRFFNDTSGAQEIFTIGDPGAYVMCTYLQPSSSAAAVETHTLAVNVRANNASLAIQAPATATPEAGIPVTIAGTTELARDLYATSKPIGAGACGQSRSADSSTDAFASGQPANAVFALPRLAGPLRTLGQYRLCAWLQEGFGDPVAEAAATAVITIVPPVPVLTALDMSPATFVARPSGGFATGGYPFSSISYRLVNTPASVRFTVGARRSGRKVGTSCVRPTRANRRRARCARYQLVPGSYTDSGTTGFNYVRFSGRIGSRRLRPGSYRLYASPRTTSGRGATLRHAFRIVRSR